MQTSARLKALVSICPPIQYDSPAADQLHKHFCSDFAQTKPVSIRGSFTHDGELLAVTARPCTARQRTHHFKNSPFLQTGDAILEFSCSLEFPGQDRFFSTDPTGARLVRTDEEAISTWRSFLPLDLSLTIQSYFCALTIAYEGVIRPTEVVWLIDDAPCRADSCHLSTIHESVEFLRRHDAFPTDYIDVETVVRWTFAQNGMFNGYSDTPASRALNYFTRLFVDVYRNDELSDLVWAFAGIEALMVEAGRSSVGQLREKLVALFGDRIDQEWLSKMVADSYNFRSRMIHGKRQIRSFFRSSEDESAKRFDEEYDSERFAVGMLVLILRFIIAKDLTAMSFRTMLAD